MTSSEEQSQPKRIIRGAFIEGVAFSPSSPKKQAEPFFEKSPNRPYNLKKELWKKILSQKLQAHEWQEIWQGGYEEGFRKGLNHGQKQGYDAGNEEGYEKGFREGIEKSKRDLESTLLFLQSLTQQLTDKKEEFYTQMKPEIIKFCLSICEKLLRKELSQSKTFLHVIENLLEQAKGIIKDSSAQIYISPEDFEMLKKDLSSIENGNNIFSLFEFVSDPQTQRGNCRIETSLGLINFDIKRLLLNLEEKVLGTKNSFEQ